MSNISANAAGFPDYTKGSTFSSGFTAPSNGWLCVTLGGSSSTSSGDDDSAGILYIDGQVVFKVSYGWSYTSGYVRGMVPIKKGQVATLAINQSGYYHTTIFYPSI